VHIAIENFQHDFNIGSVVRTANAFNVAAYTSSANGGGIGAGPWSPIGTSTSNTIRCPGPAGLGLPVIGIDNVAGSVPLEGAALPQGCVMLFGQEGRG
jgi:tRNA G18 (ribose-2'-O)-methylase SpoU